MRNRYLASFIIAIVVLVGAAALIALGFVQMTPRVYTRDFSGFGTMQVSYSIANYSLGYTFIFLGGILVIAGILLFILSEVIRSHEECCDCCDADFIDNANYDYDCKCDCGCEEHKDECKCDCGCEEHKDECKCGCDCECEK